MLLNLTTDKLSLITAEAGDVDVVLSYIDRVISTGVIGAANRQLTTITTATTTDILAVPGADTARKVEELTIRNAHASTSIDVTIQFNANGTLYELFAARLYPTEMLLWEQDKGFTIISRETKPVYQSRLSGKPSTQVSAQVTGTLNNIVTVTGCEVKIPFSPKKDQIRKVAAFGIMASFAAAGTTGLAPGIVTKQTPGDNRWSSISAVNGVIPTSETAARTGFVDRCVANGTSAIANDTPTFIAGFVAIDEADSTNMPELPIVLAVQSEIGGSGCTVTHGQFEVFEATG